MSAPPFAIPEAVIDWIRDVFAQVNQRSSSTLSRIPTTWETTLDHSLIGHLAEFAAPFRFPSNWVVNLDTHFIGGGRFGFTLPSHAIEMRTGRLFLKNPSMTRF